jgi:hypothetical protein
MDSYSLRYLFQVPSVVMSTDEVSTNGGEVSTAVDWSKKRDYNPSGLATAAIFLVIHCTSRVDFDDTLSVYLVRLWLRPFTHEARTKPGSLGLGSWAARAWST